MTNHFEKLLACVQELRAYLAEHSQSKASFDHIQHSWMPSQLFPPDETLLQQALSVLINAGELVRIERNGETIYCAKLPLEQLVDASGY